MWVLHPRPENGEGKGQVGATCVLTDGLREAGLSGLMIRHQAQRKMMAEPPSPAVGSFEQGRCSLL